MLAPGARIGRYEILGPLGEGGMGVVFLARDPSLRREVALKLLPDTLAADPVARERLLREARMAAQLNHPHICTIYEVGDADGLAYIAMERVDGRPLDLLIGSRGLPAETVVRYGTQIADALAYAHEHGVVHRDLKSANVLVTAASRVKVLDLGLAKRMATGDERGKTQLSRTLTESGAIVGTPQYVAPEILRGDAADARSDLWSLGVLLYEMASGARPFQGVTVFEVSAAILNQAPKPLPAGVPPSLATIVERCLAKDPAQRYRRADDVRDALERVVLGARTAAAPSTQRRSRPRVTAPRPAWLGAGAVVLLLIAALFLIDPARMRERLFRGGGAGRITSLAVLPLVNFSHDPDQEYFADGMTEELITTLAQVAALRVISRTSVMGFKGTTRPLPEIARKLGVDAIVAGSVQRSGDRVRITAQLIRAASEEHIWAQTFERDLRDALTLQDEVAGAIAKQVQAHLTPEQLKKFASARPVSPRGYDLYLRALDLYRRFDSQSKRAALELLEQAAKDDSTYAPTWAMIGLVYSSGGSIVTATGSSHREFGAHLEALARARRPADRALALDPDLGLGHAVEATIEMEDWNWAAAEREFRRAIELTPSLFEAHHLYSHLLMATGRIGESLEQSRITLALDPLNTAAMLHLAWHYLFAGQIERAIPQYEAALRLDPSYVEAYRQLSVTYVLAGRCDEAVAAQRKVLELGGSSDTLAWSAMVAMRCGRTDEALTLVSRLIEQVGLGKQDAYAVARVLAYLGRKDEAFQWLDRAMANHEEGMTILKQDPFLLALHSDPRFAALLLRIGLPV